jgi:hypothetical protein
MTIPFKVIRDRWTLQEVMSDELDILNLLSLRWIMTWHQEYSMLALKV